ncbi:MAG: hypothetical protein A3J46_06890 [Candidatus Yanofskybacteria bacterium RIFCSPHIGHO2_02_FULL_41_11]|uniref:O-antigen ligase-related domain-containing protein n=1 Tax=Candidatus Yanofskybacteria bacterium RIFCSPHIGHO2_02_FULL_41_11 TaxID=1802675 RepID=A0A1F8FA54_9BACT|nr:MAG: hypothetical protein A3J46_06890 [Candidatus Yanofskybacteria bacterium RIFCSPHIGHO2_02_FULL_41_11]
MKIMAKFIRYGLYLSAFIPLIVFRDFLYPFQFGKTIVFRSLIEILGGAYLLMAIRDKSYLPKINLVFGAILIFASVWCLTTLTSAAPYISFWGTLERMGGLFTFLHYILYYVLLTTIFSKKDHWHTFFNFTILAGLLSLVYGFGQTTNSTFFLDTGSSRISGTLGNPALFAGYELFVAFLSFMLFLNSTSKAKKVFYLSSFCIATIAIFATAVRGSIMGYIFGIFVFFFLWAKQKNPRISKIIFFIFIALIIGFVIFTQLFQEPSFIKDSRYLRRVSNLSLSSATVQTRIWAWEAGLKGWRENPKTIALGWGPENFSMPFAKNFNPKFFVGMTSETFFDRAHNMFIEVLVTMGIVGLLAYIGLLSAPFIYLKKILRQEPVYVIGTSAALAAYVIHNLFIFDTLPNLMMLFSLLAFTSYLGVSRKSNQNSLVGNRMIVNIISAAIIVFVSILVYKTNILPAKANHYALEAVAFGRKGDFASSLNQFKKSLSYNMPGAYEYRHQLADYLIGSKGPSLKDEGVKEAYIFTINEINKNIALKRESDHIPYLYASRLSMNLGQNDEALEYLNKALEISPTFLRTYHEIIQVYWNKEDYDKSIEYAQRAIELNPDAGASYWYLGITYAKMGKIDEAVILIRKAAKLDNFFKSQARAILNNFGQEL